MSVAGFNSTSGVSWWSEPRASRMTPAVPTVASARARYTKRFMVPPASRYVQFVRRQGVRHTDLVANARRGEPRNSCLRVERDLVQRRAVLCTHLAPAAHHERTGACFADALAIVHGADTDGNVEGARLSQRPHLQPELELRGRAVRGSEGHLRVEAHVGHERPDLESSPHQGRCLV